MSWEGFVLETLLSVLPWRHRAFFYRTQVGAEIDLVIEHGDGGLWAIEIKRSLSARPERGFHQACQDLKPRRAFLVHAGDGRYPVSETIEASVSWRWRGSYPPSHERIVGKMIFPTSSSICHRRSPNAREEVPSMILTIQTRPFPDQRPGTSGLRKKVQVFEQPHYLENFVASILASLPDVLGQTLVLGGDGRYFNDQAIQTIIQLAAGHGVGRLLIGQHGILSTPAASHLIRERKAFGGIILSASHNPGGPDGDFGIKYNGGNGGPAPEKLTEAIYAQTRQITQYRRCEAAPVDLSRQGDQHFGEMAISVVDPVEDYALLMRKIFDFEAIRRLFESGFRLRFDAMSAVTGPYATRIFEEILGAPPGSVGNARPLPDFGGHHPDPNPIHAADLMTAMHRPDAPDLGAASDGDGDRNLICARGLFVTPSDSLAVLVANATLIPAYADGLKGVARSMPTSRAVDRVAEALGIDTYETPTGWKFFGNLLDADRVTICGEESAGTGSDHVREKDGIWAVLAWLNIIASRKTDAALIMREHWARHGRHYYARHDYEEVDAAKAGALMEALRERLAQLPGTVWDGETVEHADDFAYADPVDGSLTERQGVRILFQSGARVVFRLSGTGTVGATLRVYLERYRADSVDGDVDATLAPIARIADAIAAIHERLGRDAPSIVT
jgi:phosphoglucomutase